LKTRPVGAKRPSPEPAAGRRYSVNLAGRSGDDPCLRRRLLLEGRRNPAVALYFRAASPEEGGSFAAQLMSASELLACPEPPARAPGSLLLAFGPPELLPGCFLAGCDDYLKDPWTLAELEWRLRRLLPDRPRRYRFGWGSFRLQSLHLVSGRVSCPLSSPELSILRLLADHRGQVVPREALYYAIWGRAASRGSRVADVHVSRLRRKLLSVFPASAGALRSVRAQGYLLS